MRTLSDHIYDLTQNSINAGAKNIYIGIIRNPMDKTLHITIEDDGRGVPAKDLPRVTDPFFTTRDKDIRRVGLGLGLMRTACERTGGSMNIESTEGRGTAIKAILHYDNIDCTPLGDVADLFLSNLMIDHHINWTLEHRSGENGYRLTNDEVMSALGVSNLSDYTVHTILQEHLISLENELGI